MRVVLLVLALCLSLSNALSLAEKSTHTVAQRASTKLKHHLKHKAKGDYITGDQENASLGQNLPAANINNPVPRMAERHYVELEGAETFRPPPAAIMSDGRGDINSPQQLVTADTVSLAQVSETTGDKGGETANLEQGLEEIKQDIVEKSHQVMEEKKWVDQVRSITQEYELKMHRVELNINNLRTQVKGLFTKKKQIENMMLQKKLEVKLKDATSDLTTLNTALNHVKHKANNFQRNKSDVEKTINAIKTQLNRLQGKPDDAPLDESELEDDDVGEGEGEAM